MTARGRSPSLGLPSRAARHIHTRMITAASRQLSPGLRILVLMLGAGNYAFGSRSGLNNVPTADTSAAGTGVLQVYAAAGHDRKPAIFSGARIGFAALEQPCEAGFDTRWDPGRAVPVYFNAKWRTQAQASRPAFAVGLAGAAVREVDRHRLGQPQTYGVATYDAHLVRLHAGYTVQAHNNAAFVGVDRSWLVLQRKFTFRADATQIQNRAQWLASAGFTYKFTDRLNIELWQSKPTERGRSYTTAKLGCGFKY
jgi:hypothetical protein